jgi:hypothetical protein
VLERVPERVGERPPMHLHHFAFFGKLDQVAAHGILGYLYQCAEITNQHFVVQVYFMKDELLSFTLKHRLVLLATKFAVFFSILQNIAKKFQNPANNCKRNPQISRLPEAFQLIGIERPLRRVRFF